MTWFLIWMVLDQDGNFTIWEREVYTEHACHLTMASMEKKLNENFIILCEQR